MHGFGLCTVQRLKADHEAAAGLADVDAEGETAVQEGLVDEFLTVREPLVQELGAAAFYAGMLLQELLLVHEDFRHLLDDAGDGENLLIGTGDAENADGLALYAQQEIRSAARADVFIVAEDAKLVEIFGCDLGSATVIGSDAAVIRAGNDDAMLVHEIDLLWQHAVDLTHDLQGIMF